MKNKKVGVFIDDVFIPDEIPKYLDIWVTVDTFEKFTEYIENYYKENKSLPEAISFDGCLDVEQDLYMANKVVGPIFYTRFKKPSGLTCAKWLTEFCKKNEIELNCRLMVHEEFPQLAADIAYWITQYQNTEKIPVNIFKFFWKKKAKLIL